MGTVSTATVVDCRRSSGGPGVGLYWTADCNSPLLAQPKLHLQSLTGAVRVN